MKKITFTIFVLFTCSQMQAQSGVTFSCSYNGTSEVINSYGFENDDLEDDAYNVSGLVNRILQVYNIPSKIQVTPSAQVNNAVAAAKDGKPYILYSKYFVENIRNKTDGQWKLMGIFAHEVGHHILFHTLGNSSSRRDLELEADKWAGATLYKLGATLNQALTCVEETNVNGSSTHPPRTERQEAVRSGWNEAQKQGGGRKTEPVTPTNGESAAEIQYAINNALNLYTIHDFTNAFPILYKYRNSPYFSAISQVTLGSMYENGWGVNPDKYEAVKWYRKAAEQGEAQAQRCLGVMYREGFGVGQDYNAAYTWFKKSAEQGDPLGQVAFGQLLISGNLGNILRVPEAREWFQKAANQGSIEGKAALENLNRTYK